MLARSLKTLSLGGNVTLGMSAMTGPSGIFSRSCLTMFRLCRISSTRTQYRSYVSPFLPTGTLHWHSPYAA